MRRQRSAKIVATLGPSSSTPERIEALFEAGVDVFRLNFSHGTHREHQARFEAIRRVEHATGRPIGILADLQGPKLRLGAFAAGRIELAAGAHLRLDLDPCPGDQMRAPLPHPEIFAALQPGTQLLLDDGKVRLETESCGADFAETRCLVGGTLSDRKGVNLPNAVLPVSAVTEKDRADLAFALDHGADWIALSFVQRPDDVAEGRKLVGGRAGIMVKLEKPAAIQRLVGDHRTGRRADGGARRSRRRDAARGRAERAETGGPRLPARRQAGGRRDPDARIDDRLADADPRRNLRCRHRGL